MDKKKYLLSLSVTLFCERFSSNAIHQTERQTKQGKLNKAEPGWPPQQVVNLIRSSLKSLAIRLIRLLPSSTLLTSHFIGPLFSRPIYTICLVPNICIESWHPRKSVAWYIAIPADVQLHDWRQTKPPWPPGPPQLGTKISMPLRPSWDSAPASLPAQSKELLQHYNPCLHMQF